MSTESGASVDQGGFYVHPQAICETASVGAGTRIWAFAHVLPQARIGRDCNICDGVFIENDVVLGDRVTIKCGVQLWDGLTLEDNAFVGPNATFTNTLFPRSKEFQEVFLRTVVCRNASIGANATILPGLRIGENAMVGAGSVVTQSVPPNAIVFGNPARIVGFVDGSVPAAPAIAITASTEDGVALRDTGVKGATLHRLDRTDSAAITACGGGFGREIPFLPRKFRMTTAAADEKVRGQHALRTGEQFLVCVKGSCVVLADDGERRREITLDDASWGLYLPAMTWSTLFRFSPDAMLLEFESGPDEAEERIADYVQFQREIGQ